MNNILEIDKLNAVLPSVDGPVFVLNDISFKIQQGAIIGLVGESGSGKTQLSMAFSGMQDLTPGVVSGSVKINIDNRLINIYPTEDKVLNQIDIDFNNNLIRRNEYKYNSVVLKNTSYLKRNVFGWIPQDPRNFLNPFWKLSRLFQESFNLRAQTDKDFTFNDALSFAKFYLDQVDMDSSQMISKYPHELSGGECQRAMIAFVLSKKPSFIIADESTTGLDVSRQKKVINLLKKIKEGNPELTMILISHDFGFLHHLVDQYMVMLGSFLVEQNIDKNDIKYPDSLHPYTNELLSKLWSNEKQIKESKLRYISFLEEQIDVWGTRVKESNKKIEMLKYSQHYQLFKEKLDTYNEEN
tara:strand:- start:1824 stop:2888 length:1065 start_codon:yes stop_codon:yes gene_type:complete